jgi:hypothetical protein
VGLRLVGGALALLLAAFAVRRYRKGLLRRGEFLVVFIAVLGLVIAATVPQFYDPMLSPLGLEPGDQRRLIGVLVFSNFFLLALLLRGFTRDQQLAKEIGDHVDYTALRRFQEEGWNPASGACVVVVPAFNEGANLPAMLAEVPAELFKLPVEVIVVVDGCTDDTELVARRLGAAVIRRDLRRGQGAAVRLGYLAALGAEARVIVTMDADGQHDPSEMEQVVAPILEGEADMVQGSRVLGHFEVESGLRMRGVRLYAKLLTALWRTKITDPSNGYRAVAPDALRRLDLRQDQFFVSELLMDALHKELRVTEVPVTIRRRASGDSKKGTDLRYAWGFTRTLLGTWLRQPSGNGSPSVPRWISSSAVSSPGSEAPPADITRRGG